MINSRSTLQTHYDLSNGHLVQKTAQTLQELRRRSTSFPLQRVILKAVECRPMKCTCWADGDKARSGGLGSVSRRKQQSH
jgi:hypothetical protein